jgi:hypothetical protein
MTRKLLIIISIAAVFSAAGCIKETYNMDTLSKQVHLSPTIAVSAVRGDISLSDLIDPTDTVVFESDNFIRLVFKMDSVIKEYKISDYADFDNLAEFHINEGYSVFGVSVNNLDDTVTFEPGNDIEIVKIGIITGSVNFKVTSKTLAAASFTITLPTVKRGGVPITKNIPIPANQTTTGSVSIDNTEVDLSTDPKKRYNRLPVRYSISTASGSFNLNDSMYVQVDIPAPDFDYVKGYFGQQTKIFEPDTMDLKIKNILDHITGDFLFSSPSIKLNYSNSFALPVRVDLQARGYKLAETVDLGFSPLTLSYPAAPAERDKEASFTIDKTNSSLPELVSMPPEKVRFAGSAVMNPQGNTGARDNYLFGDSRFFGTLEIEVPLEFRINNLSFTDTLDNFMQPDNSADSPVNPEDFEFLRIDITAENGFPLGVSLSMILYDSTTHTNKCTIDATDILEPAPVDANGKVTTPVTCETSIEINRDFWDSVDEADKIIFKFTLNSTDSGTRDVRIYSDYKIDFKAALVLKPDIKVKIK